MSNMKLHNVYGVDVSLYFHRGLDVDVNLSSHRGLLTSTRISIEGQPVFQ